MEDAKEGNEESPEDSDEEAKFFHACSIGDEKEAEKCIKKMCNINYQNHIGQTGLIVAAHLGYTKIVGLLLKCGADTDLVDAWGMTPLMLAVLGGHYDSVEILLENGANKSSRNSSCQTAKEIAVNLGDKNIIKLLDSYSDDTNTTHSDQRIPEIVISGDNKNSSDNGILQKQIFLTPTSRLPTRYNEGQLDLNSIVRHIKRRSKSCDLTKRKKSILSKSEELFKFIIHSDGLEKYWQLFKEHEIDLKIFFTLNEEDFESIGIIDRDDLDKLLELSYLYKSLFNVV